MVLAQCLMMVSTTVSLVENTVTYRPIPRQRIRKRPLNRRLRFLHGPCKVGKKKGSVQNSQLLSEAERVQIKKSSFE
jgi:hypothetical protein